MRNPYLYLTCPLTSSLRPHDSRGIKPDRRQGVLPVGRAGGIMSAVNSKMKRCTHRKRARIYVTEECVD